MNYVNELVEITDRIGQIGKNNLGTKMIIIKYNSRNNIDVYFPDTNYIAHNREYKDFLKGEINSRYDKTVLGIGYLGEGKYKTSKDIKVNKGSNNTNQYRCWINMLHRCYDSKLHIKRPTYIGCSVCEEWLNFQNFAKWYDENYYEVEDGEEMHLDKDILIKGNKAYSPETCVFVPVRINSLFKINNPNDLPPGISVQSLKYKVYCRDENFNTAYLGTFKNINEAFNVYKKYKESVFKLVADKYKEKIPQKLYEAMYNYQIYITD